MPIFSVSDSVGMLVGKTLACNSVLAYQLEHAFIFFRTLRHDEAVVFIISPTAKVKSLRFACLRVRTS